MTEESCCPKDSWPELKLDYVCTGHDETFIDLPLYVNGDPSRKKAIVLLTDVFGPPGGRTKAIADHFALEGYYAVVPDFFRGYYLPSFPEFIDWGRQFPYENKLQNDVRDRLLPFLQSKGIESVGLIGFCYGCWVVFNICADESFDLSMIKCGVNCHPSLGVETRIFERDPLPLVRRVRVPQLLLPAGNDPDDVKPGGEVLRILGEKEFGGDCETVVFPEQQHGWVVRGDLNVEATKRDCELAIERALHYFARFV